MTMASIKEIPQEELKYQFICKKCGHNISSPVSLATHKFGAPGLGFTQIDICTNCFKGENLRF